MNKKMLISNIILITLVMIGDIIYIGYNTQGINLVSVKSITSGLFVLLGAINILNLKKIPQANLRFSAILLTGLTFAFLGDVMIEVNFILGALLFALGHIFFFVSFISLQEFKWKDLIIAGAIFVPITLMIIFAPMFNFESILMEIVVILYALIISIMVSKAISNMIRTRSTLNIIIAIGTILFMFSDLMLLFKNFGTMDRTIGLILCLATYYPAECILAYSINHAQTNTIEKNN